MERQLAQSIASDQWRLNRMRAIEDNILSLGASLEIRKIEANHPEIDAAINMAMAYLEDPHRFHLLSLYIQRASRELHRNLALLRQLQADRRAARVQALEEAARMKEACAERSIPFDTHSYPTLVKDLTGEPASTGFDFSSRQLESFRFHDRFIRRQAA
jgi:hypothetical protein